ncbi:YdeI/OmpD-associated family protein [Paenibacillus nasutitermitis]|uniref:Bacteriocin-protection protein n=1 Tax=Paenibacillus nasutitermitis TaxID=1652958 RepID=A0A916ZD26_9BACL|nr:hypothetical protein [Paenibacillus nasutitermitis]GGD89743.1 hypothetical protein GCM10010911_55480 [Paenibacillus nasutitermitis]
MKGEIAEWGSDPLEFIDITEATDWESWLESHYERREGVWLRIAKKDSGIHSISISDALDVALCYGWIDSHRKGFNKRITCSAIRQGDRKALGP